MNEPPLKIVFVISLDCLSDREHHFPARLLQRARQSKITSPSETSLLYCEILITQCSTRINS